MSLSLEWEARVNLWGEVLRKNMYTPVGALHLSGYKCMEQITVEEAQTKEFVPMPAGTAWGKKWEYCWFKCEVILPGNCLGKRIILDAKTGGESTIYVNGKVMGSNRKFWEDIYHQEIVDLIITMDGKPGDRYEILVEAYGSHGTTDCQSDNMAPGYLVNPEPPQAQKLVEESTFGIWNEEIYQLWLDYKMLLDIRNHINENSLRVMEIDKALKEVTVQLDFEQDFDKVLQDVRRCKELLKPLMESKNGSTMPVMHTFGHSHLDIAWLWPLAETDRKCARTLSTQIRHMDEYPEYVYLQSQPYLYERTKTLYPELYKRLQEKVANGQFIPEGGMYVEADTNLTGGESLIRQFIHGKRFFKEEFGVDNELLWLPDVFGYSGALPQIMNKCGVKYFSTQKIFWTYNGGDRFPYHYFWWKGIDGSEVISFIHIDYNSKTDAAAVITRWDDRVQKEGFSDFLFPFGYGDGGGGATRDHMENIRRLSDLEGVPKVKMNSPVEYFHELEQKGNLPTDTYVGELYFQAHRGVLTSQAKTKRGNRKSEFMLRECELWSVLANASKGYQYDLKKLDELWKKVLLNQFHDILPGSSIERVYEEAEKDYHFVLENGGEIMLDAVNTFCENGKGMTLYNSLSWERNTLVVIPDDWKGATDGNKILPVQYGRDGVKYTQVAVPSVGMITIYPADENDQAVSVMKADKHLLENEYLKVTVDGHGEITSIYDKEAKRELADGKCNRFKLYKDIPRMYEAWDIDSVYEYTPVEYDSSANIEVLSDGPLVSKLKVKKKVNTSIMEQIISLRKGSRRIDFETSIDWQETHKLLKVAFETSMHSDEAIHEIQFGHIKRPNHRSRPYDMDRFEVCNHKWTALAEENAGAAILNDCKYGVNVLDKSINLTLLRSPMAPAADADKGMQKFTYSFFAWQGSFFDSDIVRESYELNIPPVVINGIGESQSFFGVDAGNIVIHTVKPAEDGSNDIIVRMYESKHAACHCKLDVNIDFKRIVETDMIEKNELSIVNTENQSAQLEFKPFEIKTIRLIRG